MKRFFITAAFLCAAGLISCRNITAVASAGAGQVNVLRCVQGADGECMEQPAEVKVDVTSPLGIFLMN